MRVYHKIVINMETGETECAEWTDDYLGPVVECKGGGGGGDTVDKEYNRGMLKISQRQQEMADEMFNMFKYGVTYDPTEIDKATGKTLGELRDYDVSADDRVSELELTQQKLAAESELLPLELKRQRALTESQTGLIEERTPVVSQMYKDALLGVDIDKRVSEARAGVQHAFKGSQATLSRDLSRFGIDPSSGRGRTAFEGFGIERAKKLADVEADIRREADKENFQRRVTAAGIM